MTYKIYHKSSYEYQHLVTFSHNLVRLKPRETHFQKIEAFKLEILPGASNKDEFDDYFGNHNTHLLIRESHSTLELIATSRVSVDVLARSAYLKQAALNRISVEDTLAHLHRFDGSNIDVKQYLFPTPRTLCIEALKAYALLSFAPNRPLFEAVSELTRRIYEEFTFESGFSDVSTPVEEVFEAKKGVCQDFAHLAITALRSLGFAVRYVSGYIETDPPKGEEKLFGVDASHAWFSVFIPQTGWVDFDPTNNLVVRERHIVLGWGRDYDDIAPLQGVVRSSGESRVNVMVDVRAEEKGEAR